MLFTEPLFLFVFLPVCLISQLLVKNVTARNVMLLVMSLLFYAWGEPVYIFLMLATSLLCWALCLWMSHSKRSGLVFALSVAAALLPLLFFKYGAMITGLINLIPGLNIPFRKPALPIGISFYTFQIITYAADLYRGETSAQKSPLSFMLYISLFPQLIAGPIVRYTDVERQLAERPITAPMFSDGVLRFVVGLGKKALLANTVGKVVADIFANPLDELGAVGVWGAMLCYAFQIYFDFSGYSDMAIGLGKMLGFTYKENFDHPYISRSVKEFWRRWHISMNTFFRDYVYIPLGGNRRHQLFNMLVVWSLTGLWHGAGPGFLLWGLYFFVLLSIGRLLGERLRLPAALAIPFTFALVVFGWTLFYFESMADLGCALRIMFGGGAAADPLSLNLLRAALPTLGICAVGSTPLPAKAAARVRRALDGRLWTALCAAFTVAMLFVSVAAIIGDTYNPFLYFRF